MSAFVGWLEHRMDTMRIYGWDALSDVTGLSLGTIKEVCRRGNLTPLPRSRRRWLATALRVSLKRLEQLDDALIDDIPDNEICDVGRRETAGPAGADDWNAPYEPDEPDDGTPAIARQRPDSRVEIDEDWNPFYGRRLPVKFAPGQYVYAIEKPEPGQFHVFRQAQVFEIGPNRPASVYVWRDFTGDAYVCHLIRRDNGTVRLVMGNGEREDVEAAMVVRAGKYVGEWPLAEAAG